MLSGGPEFIYYEVDDVNWAKLKCCSVTGPILIQNGIEASTVNSNRFGFVRHDSIYSKDANRLIKSSTIYDLIESEIDPGANPISLSSGNKT